MIRQNNPSETAISGKTAALKRQLEHEQGMMRRQLLLKELWKLTRPNQRKPSG